MCGQGCWELSGLAASRHIRLRRMCGSSGSVLHHAYNPERQDNIDDNTQDDQCDDKSFFVRDVHSAVIEIHWMQILTLVSLAAFD